MKRSCREAATFASPLGSAVCEKSRLALYLVSFFGIGGSPDKAAMPGGIRRFRTGRIEFLARHVHAVTPNPVVAGTKPGHDEAIRSSGLGLFRALRVATL